MCATRGGGAVAAGDHLRAVRGRSTRDRLDPGIHLLLEGRSQTWKLDNTVYSTALKHYNCTEEKDHMKHKIKEEKREECLQCCDLHHLWLGRDTRSHHKFCKHKEEGENARISELQIQGKTACDYYTNINTTDLIF